MRRLPYILFLFVLYLAFCGKSCVDDSDRAAWQEKVASAAKDSIRSEFEAGNLIEESRFAAEVTAIQKLKDLSDYLEIFTDVSLDTVFRAKALDMISEMFVSENCKLSFGPMKNSKMRSSTLGKFFDNGFGEDILKSAFIFDSVTVSEPLQKSGETYSGKLAAYQTVILFNPTDSIISPAIPISIHFISSKKNKIIGSDTLSVWVVSLWDMDF